MAKALSLFTKYVRPDVPECPEIIILDAIRQAGIEFCKRTKVDRVTVVVNTLVDIPSYTIDVGIGKIADEIIRVSRDATYYLTPSSEDDFIHEAYDTLTGTPQYYYFDNGSMVLGTVPSGVEALNVLVKVRPSEDATELLDELYNRYLVGIAAGAKAILMLSSNKAWSNTELAAYNTMKFEQAIDSENLRYAKGGGSKPLRTVLHTF